VFTASIVRAMMMEAPNTSETPVNYQTTRRNNPEDSHLHTRRRENLKFDNNILITPILHKVIFILSSRIFLFKKLHSS
jgi:hypothetical protein